YTHLFYLFDMFLLFFFSSRRRHTRFSRDWSSDVCSSDLRGPAHHYLPTGLDVVVERRPGQPGEAHQRRPPEGGVRRRPPRRRVQIGRASCRERVWISMVDGAVLTYLFSLLS